MLSGYLEGDEHKECCAQLFGFINQEFEILRRGFGSENNYDTQLDSSCYDFSVLPSLIRVYKEAI